MSTALGAMCAVLAPMCVLSNFFLGQLRQLASLCPVLMTAHTTERKDKAKPFGVNFSRSLVIYWAAQAQHTPLGLTACEGCVC